MAEQDRRNREPVPWDELEINVVPKWFRRRRKPIRRPTVVEGFVEYPRQETGTRRNGQIIDTPLTREQWEALLGLRRDARSRLTFTGAVSCLVPMAVLQLAIPSKSILYLGSVYWLILVTAFVEAVASVSIVGKLCRHSTSAMPELEDWYDKWRLSALLTPLGGLFLGGWLLKKIESKLRRHGLRVFPLESHEHALQELLTNQECDEETSRAE